MNSSSLTVNSKLSAFAQALARLLDETDFYARDEWASFLGISTSAISQWVNDKTIPRADVLRMIIDLLRTRGGEAAAAKLKQFERLWTKPAIEVSPLGARMSPTVKAYLERSSFVGLGRELRGMQPEEQISVLASGSWEKSPSAAIPQGEHSLEDGLQPQGEFDSPLSAPGGRVLPDLQRVESGHKLRRTSWEELLDQERCLIVAGPGTGKTHLLAALATRYQDRMRISPTFIRARDYVNRGETAFVDLFVQVKGNHLLLIDGLDEVTPEVRLDAIRQIMDGSHRVRTVRCIVASRPIPELALLSGFESFSLAPLSGLQIVLALSRAIQGVPNRGTSVKELQRFLCHLSEKPSLYHFFGNPLLLTIGWTLFERSAVTPFSEAEVLGECVRSLLERDYQKDVVRVREPWASPQYLSSLLGALSFQSVTRGRTVFSTEEASTWIDAKFSNVPIHELLSLLEIQGLIHSKDDQYTFGHISFRDYFAALYVVESAGSASEYLTGWKNNPEVREVFRLACGITNDATSLLKGVLRANKVADASRCALLAEILAQPVAAERGVVEESCDTLIRWLDAKLEGWSIELNTTDRMTGAEPSWEMSATGKSIGKAQILVQSTLSAIHRARSGTARVPLKERMKEAKSVVLPRFADSMEIEGKLEVEFIAKESSEVLRAAIDEL